MSTSQRLRLRENLFSFLGSSLERLSTSHINHINHMNTVFLRRTSKGKPMNFSRPAVVARSQNMLYYTRTTLYSGDIAFAIFAFTIFAFTILRSRYCVREICVYSEVTKRVVISAYFFIIRPILRYCDIAWLLE